MKRIATASGLGPRAAALAAAIAISSGHASAGPAARGDLDAHAPGSELPPAPLWNPVPAVKPAGAAGTENSASATNERGATRPNAHDPPATSGQLAAEILQEAGIGAAASAADTAPPLRGQSQQPAPPGSTRAGSPARAASGVPEDNAATREVRNFGKSALAWLKEAVPWLQSDEEERNAAAEGSADWDGGPVGAGGTAVAGVMTGRALAGDSLTGGAGGDGDGGASGDPLPQGYEPTLVREAVAFVKKVFTHPMTWLVVTIFVIGGIAMSLADRRPK
jgi:hypothetical protein